MSNKKWNVKESAPANIISEISSCAKVSPLVSQLLYNRGMTNGEKAKAFVTFSDSNLHDPFLIPDMDKAVERIHRAIENNEKVVIYGDYDVDGVTSVSILWLYFKSHGINAGYYIPDRKGEGYGVNLAAIDQFSEDKVTLMITVDTGVTALDETEYAKSLGIDVVITDHHECHSKLPDASAVVNPRRQDSEYPFKELAGVGVVFKLICALIEEESRKANCNGNFLKDVIGRYIDLVAMGTIADVMPLVDENRLFVSLGLKKINESPRLGLDSLINAAQNSNTQERQKTKKQLISSSTISYTVAPRINAAGRIDNAGKAVELFLTNDEKRADEIAEELCRINKARQAEENRIIEEAAKKIDEEFDFKNNKVIVLDDECWHHGVIGIVASRITEKYSLPSILISFEGDIGKGSGRSVKGVNLVEVLSACSQYLIKFGGHELAAGLTVDRSQLEDFKKSINEYVKEHVDFSKEVDGIDVDMLLSMDDVSIENAESLLSLEPYGVANPIPLFEVRDLKIYDIMPLGQKHTRITLKSGNRMITALFFGKERSEIEFYSGDQVDIIASLNINEFRDTRSVQFILKDIRLSSSEVSIDPNDRIAYKDVVSGEKFDRSLDYVPNRDDVSAVYLYVKHRVGSTRDEYMGIREILSALKGNPRINYVKLRVILDILSELGVISSEYSGENDENVRFSINFVKNKVDIEKSATYIRIKNSAIK